MRSSVFLINGNGDVEERLLLKKQYHTHCYVKHYNLSIGISRYVNCCLVKLCGYLHDIALIDESGEIAAERGFVTIQVIEFAYLQVVYEIFTYQPLAVFKKPQFTLLPSDDISEAHSLSSLHCVDRQVASAT